ncbi:hypothetical protein C8R43DRAFT_284116 [Mycena crocata]|nr:hypothetical protein C8R43DRAFT_284116 [Mycena crocata]
MSVEPSWSKIARNFDQTDPRHMDLHARIMSDTVIQSEDIILNLKSLVSVLWRLPPEILIKIFGIDTGVDPVRISQVCARWRYVSLGTPSLWCHIDIRLYGPGRNVDDVARFLERSRDYPLTVKLYCEKEIGNSDSALDLLIQESNRWADVELFIPAALVLSLAPIRGRVSALRRLNINLMACADEDPLLPTLSAFEIAPLLREYKAFHNGLISFFLPWEQLTSYHVWEEDLSALFKCLPRMTNLVVCRIYGPLNDLSYNPQPALTNIHLPHLRTLTIKEGEPTGAIQDGHDHHPWALLELLTLPELRTLKIASCAKARDLMPKLKGLVMRSSCSLETFSLEMYTTRINIKVLSFLKLTPTLLDLRLKCNKMTLEFILGLTRGESKFLRKFTSKSSRIWSTRGLVSLTPAARARQTPCSY